MTLITRLSAAFTDTTLPILQRDPVLPDVGGRYLIDAASAYSVSELTEGANSYNAPIYSLTNDSVGATTGADVGEIRFRLKIQQGDSLLMAQVGYDSAAKAFKFPDQSDHPSGTFAGLSVTTDGSKRLRFIESNSGSNGKIITDLSHSYCLSAWITIGTSTKNTLFGHISGPNINSGSGPILFYASPAGIQIGRRFTGAYLDWVNNTSGLPRTEYLHTLVGSGAAGLYHVGMAWYKKDGIWYQRSCLNNTPTSELVNSVLTAGYGIHLDQDTNNGVRDPRTCLGFGGEASSALENGWWGSDHKLHRLYFENITQSGRTPEQVWAADWARGNGRFS